MTTYSTYDPTALFAGEPPTRQRSITLASGSNTTGTPLKRGTLLGRITSTDKYIPSIKTASDGSQNAAAILAIDTDAGAADVLTPAYFEGEFAGEMMTLDASWTITTLQAALRQSGSAIYVRSVGVLG